MVPDVWFEQTTYRLQGDCTTTVLIRRKLIILYLVLFVNQFPKYMYGKICKTLKS